VIYVETKILAIILVACGIGILLATIVRGYNTMTLKASVSVIGESRKVLEGIWASREVYLNVIIRGGKIDVSLYSNGKLLKKMDKY